MTDRPELPKIRNVRARPHYRLELQWEHGEASTVDMRSIIGTGGVFNALRDYDFFSTVHLGERGRYVEWRSPINSAEVIADIDADTLIRMADAQEGASALERFIKTVRNRLVHPTKEPA